MIIAALAVAGIAASIFSLSSPAVDSPRLSFPSSSEESDSLNLEQITYNQQTYQYAAIEINDTSSLKLIPNFSEQKSSNILFADYQCKTLVNGGFYDPNNQPIGLFISNFKTISNYRQNQLLNGIITLHNSQAAITPLPPSEPVEYALQTGPLFIQDREPIQLSIKDDKPRRRIIAALTNNNSLYFIAIVGQDSLFTGPLLTDVPQILTRINPSIVSAINLDGGSASTFLTKDLHIKELSYIGSFFCIK